MAKDISCSKNGYHENDSALHDKTCKKPELWSEHNIPIYMYACVCAGMREVRYMNTTEIEERR